MATKIVISKVSEPYADALLELAKANNCVDAITADVNDLLTFLTSVPLLASYFENPVISMANKKELVNTVMGSKLNPYMLKFLQFLIEKNFNIYGFGHFEPLLYLLIPSYWPSKLQDFSK